MSARQVQLFQAQGPEPWNTIISQLPYAHILQSYQWGQFKSRHGWSAHHLLFKDGAVTVGAALVLQRRLPHLPWGIMYVPKGPAVDYTDRARVTGVLGALEQFACEKKAILIKIDPDVVLVDGDSLQAESGTGVTSLAPFQPTAESPMNLLRRRGWRFSNEQVQFKNTLVIDLDRTEEAILANMKPKTRYNIRLAARKGITIRLGQDRDLPAFYQLYSETSERDQFLIRPFAYYRDAWQAFLTDGLAELLLAEWEGQLLAGLMLYRLGHKAWYFYGASSNEARHLMPNYLLQWEAICHSKRQGSRVYDLWGAPDTMSETDPMWGVYRFKEGLGGRLVRHIGAYDFPANPFFFKVYTQLLPRYLSLMRLRHRHPKTTE